MKQLRKNQKQSSTTKKVGNDCQDLSDVMTESDNAGDTRPMEANEVYSIFHDLFNNSTFNRQNTIRAIAS